MRSATEIARSVVDRSCDGACPHDSHQSRFCFNCTLCWVTSIAAAIEAARVEEREAVRKELVELGYYSAASLVAQGARGTTKPGSATDGRYYCKSCGIGIKVDEDECCVTCGVDAVVVADVLTATKPAEESKAKGAKLCEFCRQRYTVGDVCATCVIDSKAGGGDE